MRSNFTDGTINLEYYGRTSICRFLNTQQLFSFKAEHEISVLFTLTLSYDE